MDASRRLRYFDALTKRPDIVNWTGVYTGYKTIQSEDTAACDGEVDEIRYGMRARDPRPRRRLLSDLTTLHRIISRVAKTFRQAAFIICFRLPALHAFLPATIY